MTQARTLAWLLAVAVLIAGRGAMAEDAKPAAKPATGASKSAPATGFARSATKPDHNAVDWQATARIPGKKGGDGKFIMRDGSRVLYQR